MRSVPLSAERISKYDAVLILTDHSSIDYGMIVANAMQVVDTRNATRNVTRGREKIVKA
jgi:UDP-N-acetyl-D-glucosamine dehydrogenase